MLSAHLANSGTWDALNSLPPKSSMSNSLPTPLGPKSAKSLSLTDLWNLHFFSYLLKAMDAAVNVGTGTSFDHRMGCAIT